MILFGHALRSSRVDYQVAALPVVPLFSFFGFYMNSEFIFIFVKDGGGE